MSLGDRVKPWVAQLEPYVPGKPSETLERELGISHSAKLASNENPLGPSPLALEAMRGALANVHRYPDGTTHRLRTKLAGRLGVEPGQLVFGAGSDEILELLAKAFLGPGDQAVFAWPSFAMYPIVVKGAGASAVPVALDQRLEHDLPALLRAVGERTRIVFVCNPNNPTGTSIGRDALARFAEALPADVILALDEAYCEFAQRPDFPDGLEWVARRPATIVLRTFSKLYGLAGVRVGYGVTGAELAGYLERARHPFNVNSIAEAGACAALDDHEHVERTLRATREGVEYLTRELRALALEVTPTDANFVLVRSGAGSYERLLREGVIVRPMGGFGLPEHVRITIGTRPENERLVRALRRLLGQSASAAALAPEAAP